MKDENSILIQKEANTTRNFKGITLPAVVIVKSVKLCRRFAIQDVVQNVKRSSFYAKPHFSESDMDTV